MTFQDSRETSINMEAVMIVPKYWRIQNEGARDMSPFLGLIFFIFM